MVGRSRRPSPAALSILRIMLEDPQASYYGLDLAKQSGRPTGTLYPLLRKMERQGWLRSEVEPIDPSVEGRPRRIMYSLTSRGVEKAREALHQDRARQRLLKPVGEFR